MSNGEQSDRPQDDSESRPKSKRRSRRRRGKRQSSEESSSAQNPLQVSSPLKEKDESQSDKPPTEQKKSNKRRARKPRATKHQSRQHRDEVPSLDVSLTKAIKLIDEAIRTEAKRLGVLRLSPIHLDFIIGDGESLSNQAQVNQIFLSQQVKKLKARISDQVHHQVPSQWRRGTIYCFDSDQAIEPPSHDSIFTGYDPLGRPQWTHLLPLCLSLQVPHLERLYAQPPRVVSLAMSSPIGTRPIPTVTDGRLYEPLAQVVLGPISSSFRPLRDTETRYTLTAQLVLTQPPERGLSIHLNVLGLDPDVLFEEAAKGAPRGPLARARNSLQNAQREVRKLQELIQLRRISRERLPSEAERILSGLSDQLIRVIHGDDGRTHHGQTRHHSMERPTSEAWRDANRVGVERLFWDGHQETIVVIGPKSRVHIFSPDGRHVTSMRLGPGELEKKTGQGRWRPLDPQRTQTFRLAVKRRVERDHSSRSRS